MNSTDKSRKNYNRLARWYDLFAGSERPVINSGVHMLNLKKNESVLEIGCGTGHALSSFVKLETKVFAIDISENMLKVARSKSSGEKFHLCQADGKFIPFPDLTFDIVFLSFTLELFDPPGITKVLDECYRVLKNKGRIGIAALARQKALTVTIYEWVHRLTPELVDCRPIYLKPRLSESGFHTQRSINTSIWGLPIEIVVAGKTKRNEL